MPRYLVETYLPRLASTGCPRCRTDIGTAATARARRTQVRYVCTTFLPDDETCFHVFEAVSEEVVAEVFRRAGIVSGRIVSAVE